MINIAGLNKEDVLRVLYDRAKVQGLGILHAKPGNMTNEESKALLADSNYFDYVNGRVMKVQIEGLNLDPRLYDRDNGAGAAEAAINTLRG